MPSFACIPKVSGLSMFISTWSVEPGQLKSSPSTLARTLFTGSSKRSMKYWLEESSATTVPPASTHFLMRSPPLTCLTSSFFFFLAVSSVFATVSMPPEYFGGIGVHLRR